MKNLLLETGLNADQIVIVALYILLAIVGIAIFVASIWCGILKFKVWLIYKKYNKLANSANLTGQEVAEKFLQINDLSNVPVKKCSWWRAIFGIGGIMGYGNNYSIYKKTIFLRKNIINKNSITAAGIATQKVGLAMLDKVGDKEYQTEARLKPWVPFFPMLFIPFVLIGVVIDVVTMLNNGGIYMGIGTLISTAIAFVFEIVGFFIMLYTIKSEKKANEMALKSMDEHNFLTTEERGYIKQIYSAYISGFIAEFVVEILKVIYDILKLVIKVLLNKNKSN